MPVILTLRRLRQEDHNLEASSGYIAKPCLKTKKSKHLFGKCCSRPKRKLFKVQRQWW
jgi:hypothetical protein